MTPNPWTTELVARLEADWPDATVRELATRYGLTVDQVKCKAARIGLPTKNPRKPHVPRPPKPPKPPEPEAPPWMAAKVALPSLRPLSLCQWPFGDPGTEDFRFCDARAVSGCPYCREHAQRAYGRQVREAA